MSIVIRTHREGKREREGGYRVVIIINGTERNWAELGGTGRGNSEGKERSEVSCRWRLCVCQENTVQCENTQREGKKIERERVNENGVNFL